MKKAETLYRSRFYASAIPIFEALLQRKEDPSVMSKLANCYRILNQSEKAAQLYSVIMSDKSARIQDVNNFGKDVFHYGEVMMMRGKYDSAKVLFKQYVALQPEDELGSKMVKACENIKTIQPLQLSVNLSTFSQNTDADENTPVFFKNKLLFASDRSQGVRFLKEKNQTTGREYVGIWAADKITDSTYGKPKKFAGKFMRVNSNTANVSFTASGKEVFFCQNDDVPNRNNETPLQIYSAESKDGKSWRHVEKLSFCSPDHNYLYPSVSPDGNHLFFVTKRGDGFGELDIYETHRTKKGWKRPQNLGATINTAAHECFPYAAANGKLYFCSKGHVGYGGFDIFVTEQDSTTGDWKKPVNLGSPINSPYDDISVTFADSTHGAFASPRGGAGDDIYFFELMKKAAGEPTQNIESNKSNAFVFLDKSSKTIENDDAFLTDTTSTKSYLDRFAILIEGNLLKKGTSFIVENIKYDSTNAVDITLPMEAEFDKLAAFLNVHRSLKVEIAAHTEGGLLHPKAVSQKRAELILEDLVAKGIPRQRLIAKGYANAKPIKDCRNGGCTEGEDFQNRRIELIVKEL